MPSTPPPKGPSFSSTGFPCPSLPQVWAAISLTAVLTRFDSLSAPSPNIHYIATDLCRELSGIAALLAHYTRTSHISLLFHLRPHRPLFNFLDAKNHSSRPFRLIHLLPSLLRPKALLPLGAWSSEGLQKGVKLLDLSILRSELLGQCPHLPV